MKLSKLTESNFRIAIQKVSSQDIPLTAAFKLKGIIKRGDEELAKYEDVRKSALERLGDRDENGNIMLDDKGGVKLSTENMQKFAAELSDLLKSEVDIGTMSVADLGNKVTISANDLMALSDIFVE